MADVTFGVKVSEELKQELTDLMKESTLSGKEFISLLMASYKLQNAKNGKEYFQDDLNELQTLLKRVQNLYISMLEKGRLTYEDALQEQEQETSELQKANTTLENNNLQLKEEIKQHINNLEDETKQHRSTKEKLDKQISISHEFKQQLNNNLLLHTKLQEEIERSNNQLTLYKHYETDLEMCNEKNSKLQQRNDELASEVWFLQREVEKLNEQINSLDTQHIQTINQLETTYKLQAKNEQLELVVKHQETVQHLQEQLALLKTENHQKEQEYLLKIEKMYADMQNNQKIQV